MPTLSISPNAQRAVGPALVFAQPLLGGDAGIEQTVDQMRQLVDAALKDPTIIRLATDIVRNVAPFDDVAEANALYEWVRGNIRFTKDPVNKEKLYPPTELLKIRAGDCDDISMLMGTLLMAVGYPARLMTVAANASAPQQFSHVYVEGEVPSGSGQWIPMDPARIDSQFGVAPPVTYRAKWWSLSDSSYGDLSGMKTRAARRMPLNLGDYPRFQSFVSGLGDDSSLQDTSTMIATVSQGVSDIIRATQGQPTNPWSSFNTLYTPGAGLTPAGYTVNPSGQFVPSLGLGTNSWMPWLLLGIGVLALSGRRL